MSAGPRSGIEGQVVIGPVRPVQRKGESSERGYETTIAVYTAGDRQAVTEFRSSPNGRFRVDLPPGDYTLEGTGRARYPVATPVEVTVEPGRLTAAIVSFDSGIR